MSKNKWSHFTFHSLITNYILLKNKIYVKIDREKLYKLQTKVYFNNIDFVLKRKQNFVGSIFSIVKKSVVFTRTRIHVSSYHGICLL